ncbi:MAG: hypothetical protein H0W25_12010 [Acidimicrobiia bacterium]|nr:hypothetical protein [Acidimicrobiia bacterium]
MDGIETGTGQERPRQLGTYGSLRLANLAARTALEDGTTGERNTLGWLVHRYVESRTDVSIKTQEQYASKAQGSWNRLTCDISVWAGGERGSVTFHGDASKPEWGPWRPLWDQLAQMVHDEIEGPLLHRILTQLMAGESVEICSLRGAGRGRLVVSAEAYKERKPFAKPIPWASITDVTPAVGVRAGSFTSPSHGARSRRRSPDERRRVGRLVDSAAVEGLPLPLTRRDCRVRLGSCSPCGRDRMTSPIGAIDC